MQNGRNAVLESTQENKSYPQKDESKLQEMPFAHMHIWQLKEQGTLSNMQTHTHTHSHSIQTHWCNIPKEYNNNGKSKLQPNVCMQLFVTQWYFSNIDASVFNNHKVVGVLAATTKKSFAYFRPLLHSSCCKSNVFGQETATASFRIWSGLLFDAYDARYRQASSKIVLVFFV